MPTTLADIAAKLGVSKMTISRAINGHPAIKDETRKKVLEVARQMKYRPNHHARALTTRRSSLLGLIVPDLMHSFYAEIAKAIVSVVRPAGYEILICSTDEDGERELAEVEAIRYRVDGLIIASAIADEKARAYQELLHAGTKIVMLDRHFKNLKCSSVTTDDAKVGFLATEYLIQLGHRRIGHLRGGGVGVGANREAGYLQALAKYKRPMEKRLVRPCGFLEGDGYLAMQKWIAEGNLPTAIFAANDPAAIGAMKALAEANIKVPDEISIIGAGNIHYADMLSVPLTTVTWDKVKMGQAATQLLLASLERDELKSKKNKLQRIILEPQLVIRKSCASPALNAKKRSSPKVLSIL